jgi:hypothetical protein
VYGLIRGAELKIASKRTAAKSKKEYEREWLDALAIVRREQAAGNENAIETFLISITGMEYALFLRVSTSKTSIKGLVCAFLRSSFLQSVS